MSKRIYLFDGATTEERIAVLRQTFESSIDRNANSKGCWLWNRSTTKKKGGGYGNMATRGLSHKKTKTAHSISYFLHSLASGKEWNLDAPVTFDHTCHVRNCVNPHHLIPMSLYENHLHKPRFVLGLMNRLLAEYPSAEPEIRSLQTKLKEIVLGKLL